MSNKILVLAKNYLDACNFLDNILINKGYNNDDYKVAQKSMGRYNIVLNNNDEYNALSVSTPLSSSSLRGRKFDQAYIQNTISSEIIDIIIKPTLAFSDVLEEERIIYFE